MTEPWHLLLSWGVFSGISSGAVAIVLGATVVNRWFSAHRGLVMGLLTASAATGTLVFLPALAALASSGDWTRVVWAVAAAAAARCRWPGGWCRTGPRRSDWCLTAAIRLAAGAAAPSTGMIAATFGAWAGPRTRTFWFLFATFFICGFTTNGLVGTHLIALCGDHGMPKCRPPACWR